MESNFSSSSITSASMSSLIRTASSMVNTTHQAILRNLTVTNNVNIKEESIMSSRRYFMHMIGGWLLTAIFLFGISFMFVTHFLGRREWRRYQQRLEEERKAVNHVIVDPKFMKYTKNGWKDIAFSL